MSVKTFPERLSYLEKNQDNISEAVNQLTNITNSLVNQSKMAFQAQRESLDGIYTVLTKAIPNFKEDLAKHLEALQAERDAKRVEQEKMQVNQLVETNQLAPATVIGEKSVLLIGTLTNSETAKVLNSHVMVQLPALPPEIAEEFKGKTIGFEHASKETPERFTVTEIYDTVEQKEVPPAPAASEVVEEEA